MNERVAEPHVPGIVGQLDHGLIDEVLNVRIEGGGVESGHGLQGLAVEGPPDDGRQLGCPLGGSQLVEPGGDDLGQGGRDALAAFEIGRAVGHGSGQLLQEKRYPVGPLNQGLLHLGRQLVAAGHAGHHGQRVVRLQSTKVEAMRRHVRMIVNELGTGRQHLEHRVSAAGHMTHHFNGARVGPMDVFDQQQQRTIGCLLHDPVGRHFGRHRHLAHQRFERSERTRARPAAHSKWW